MMEEFAAKRVREPSAFRDLNHASKAMILVPLLIPAFAHRQASNFGELPNRDTGTLRAVD